MDVRDRFIQRVVKGRTFAEVGGLWGTVNEKASVAHAAGARELTMIDVALPDGKWWLAFEQRRQELDLPPVRAVSGDIMQLASTDASLRFEVVHCSGILYHVPDPLLFVQSLRKITSDYLILTSSITETDIRNDAGRVQVPKSGALFLPALDAVEKAVLKRHWSDVVPDNALGLTLEIERWDLSDFGPWWWLPTTEVLAAMCRVAGFDVVDLEHLWNGHAATLLLKTSA